MKTDRDLARPDRFFADLPDVDELLESLGLEG